MLVKKLYYGRREISSIYLNYKLIWRLRKNVLLYPVQTDTNLYIPQIYKAIQNGTNVDFTRVDNVVE